MVELVGEEPREVGRVQSQQLSVDLIEQLRYLNLCFKVLFYQINYILFVQEYLPIFTLYTDWSIPATAVAV